MKKRILAALVSAAAVLSLAGCGNKGSTSTAGGASNAGGDSAAASTPAASAAASEGGAASEAGGDESAAAPAGDTVDVTKRYELAEGEDKTLTICVWNEEWQKFFQKYYVPDYLPEGVEVVWDVKPSDGGAYQEMLDKAFLENGGKDADGHNIDLFLAEADYISKYVNSPYTKDLTEIGLSTDLGDRYAYTQDACTTFDGKVKGASFQACPNALIYRRSIAKEVLGTDDPDEVQSKLDSWDKFNAVAATAKENGYYMTASAVETYRTFSNNATKAYMDDDNNFQLTDTFDSWISQAEDFVKNGYTLTDGIWGDEKKAQMGKDGKTMCFFGPAWYYNFCMTPARDEAMGDWAICKGPMETFWGGTWMLASASTDNPGLVAHIIKAFYANETILNHLVQDESQYVNSKTIMKKYADDPNYKEEFLGGQNGMKIMYEIAEGITWNPKLHTIYDQVFNESLPDSMLNYLKGTLDSRDAAMEEFYKVLDAKCKEVKHP